MTDRRNFIVRTALQGLAAVAGLWGGTTRTVRPPRIEHTTFYGDGHLWRYIQPGEIEEGSLWEDIETGEMKTYANGEFVPVP